eukprot:13808823-Alexandrium_andersonii.AAC.1
MAEHPDTSLKVGVACGTCRVGDRSYFLVLTPPAGSAGAGQTACPGWTVRAMLEKPGDDEGGDGDEEPVANMVLNKDEREAMRVRAAARCRGLAPGANGPIHYAAWLSGQRSLVARACVCAPARACVCLMGRSLATVAVSVSVTVAAQRAVGAT